MTTQIDIRKPSAAGALYPADPAELTRELSQLFAEAKGQRLAQPPLVVIAPHSELQCSGAVAASALSHLVGHQYDSVVVIAPSHRGFFPGASVFDGEAYQTPLGDIQVDSELVAELTTISPHVSKSALGHTGKAYDEEFSLEAILPYLQLTLGEFSLVPIITGDQEVVTARALGDCLHACLKNRNALVVVSTDLSHYHDSQTGAQLDAKTRKTILSMDAERLINLFLARQVEACGVVGLIASLFVARRKGIDEVCELSYCQSQVSDDEVIGHAGIVITRSAVRREFVPSRDTEDERPTETLESVKNFLHSVASRAILNSVTDAQSVPAPHEPHAQRQLREKHGVFVSIYQEDKLIGRAGLLRSNKELPETVAEVAHAAYNDSTLTTKPPTEQTLASCHFVIHLLSPLHQVRNFEEFDPLTQGALVKLEMNSAYMFPDEIAAALHTQEPTVSGALDAICLKAKLPRNSYADKFAEVFVFDIESF